MYTLFSKYYLLFAVQQIALHDSVIQMVRGIDPVISKNALARPGTPEAKFKITHTGLFIILNTEVSQDLNRRDMTLILLT